MVMMVGMMLVVVVFGGGGRGHYGVFAVCCSVIPVFSPFPERLNRGVWSQDG